MESDKTWLFVPAKEKYIKNVASIDADVLILDLEDALAQTQKAEGLKLAVEVVKSYGKKRDIYVRLNADNRFEEELHTLMPYDFAGYMIPKFEDAFALEKYRESLIGKVIALVESVKGVMQLEDIAAHSLVNKIAFGGEDFCRELGFGAGEEATLYARSKLVMLATYYKKYSLDTICLEIRNMEEFLQAFCKTKRIGFQSKLLIHPNQVKAVRDCNRNIDKAYLEHILEIYRKSKDGIVQVDGRVYEKPHIIRIEQYLQEFERK